MRYYLAITWFIACISLFACKAPGLQTDKRLPVESSAESTTSDILKEPVPGMKFVQVPGGSYQMGCGSWIKKCSKNEKPGHKVRLDGFLIGEHEVTVKQFRQFVREKGYSGNGYNYNATKQKCSGMANSNIPQENNHPVACVSWNEADAFAEWLTEKSQGNYLFRLPTEAEWEYACRSGGKPEKECGGSDLDKISWWAGNSKGATHPVGTKSPNGLGLFDMTGNVWEWCGDFYGDYSPAPVENPKGPYNGSKRVLRGGGWFYPYLPAGIYGSLSRRCSPPDYRSSQLGFRLVCIPAIKESKVGAKPAGAAVERGTLPDGCRYKGETINGKPDGQGEITCPDTSPDGRKYAGQFKDGLLHGKGELTFPSGMKATGSFKDDQLDGQGSLILADGRELYRGNFKKGLPEGRGTFSMHEGVAKYSDFDYFFPNRPGTLTRAKGVIYTGEFKSGLPCGQGTYTFPDGRKHRGQFKDGVPNGHGIYTLSGGETMEGEFKAGWITQGTLAFKGYQFEGKFEKNEPDEYGTLTYPNGRKYTGWIKKGFQHWHGIEISPDGTEYDGQFQNGVKHGWGVMTYPDGEKQEGVFNNGKYAGNSHHQMEKLFPANQGTLTLKFEDIDSYFIPTEDRFIISIKETKNGPYKWKMKAERNFLERSNVTIMNIPETIFTISLTGYHSKQLRNTSMTTFVLYGSHRQAAFHVPKHSIEDATYLNPPCPEIQSGSAESLTVKYVPGSAFHPDVTYFIILVYRIDGGYKNEIKVEREELESSNIVFRDLRVGKYFINIRGYYNDDSLNSGYKFDFRYKGGNQQVTYYEKGTFRKGICE